VFNARAATLLGVPAEPAAMLAAVDSVGSVVVAAQDVDLGGKVLEVRTSLTGDGGFVRTFSDVTERRMAEARILHVAHHDPLTGIANRALFNEKLAQEIGDADGSAGPSVVICGLDGFKQVNYMRGHEVGDEILRSAAERLLEACGGRRWSPESAATSLR
jgi:predicted signal transduction protein with EAL and GGDEF domain